jgi:hypothetical protein
MLQAWIRMKDIGAILLDFFTLHCRESGIQMQHGSSSRSCHHPVGETGHCFWPTMVIHTHQGNALA